MPDVELTITPRQEVFIDATADEVLFGGAAGGGKSHGQLIDAFIYAMTYPKSKQVIFRRTFPELEKSIIRTALEIFPAKSYKYNSSQHTMKFVNGSILDFAYCDSETDVYKYQSSEFDVIRFDELTHFTETMYTYMMSRLRGTRPYPRSMRSSTNPGGIGHSWVKDRFIKIGPPDKVHSIEVGDEFEKVVTTRIFIPSKVDDNLFLMAKDKGYKARMQNLDERRKRALLYGDWDIEGGFFFSEFKRGIHICEPFKIPTDWRRYRAIDYGLDRFACLWIAVNSLGECFVYREFAQPDMVISDAAKKAVELTADENIKTTYAPPDLWGRSQESGKCRADLFRSGGLILHKSDNNRVSGWACIKEMLKPNASGDVKLYIFDTCRELTEHIATIQVDEKNPNDCATQPHDITHLPDALRYFAIMHYKPNAVRETKKGNDFTFEEKAKHRIVGQDLTKILRR